MTSTTFRETAATRAWRAFDSVRGGPWPYCVVAFHRVWDGSRDELSYPVEGFTELCRYWRDHYEIMPLERVLTRLAHGDGNPHPALAITFDDGYADNAEVAAPILDRLGLNATFFITAGYMGTGHRFPWDADLAERPRLMTWAQVRELHREGFGIGSHTLHHARLSSVHGPELAEELEASKRRLESELGDDVLDFAFPYGQPSDYGFEAAAAVERAGYRCALACAGGLNHPGNRLYHLRRVSVSPVYHATPAAWARFYAGLRWRTRGQARRQAA